MGLSASQARLLSITRRINNNELKSAILANSKIRLADKNIKATNDYVNALDTTKLNYVSYDETGIQQFVPLTFTYLNQYSPLKNQYALYNDNGQLYVNQLDADNFAKSKTLYDFLECYNLVEGRTEQVENPEYQRQYKEWYEYNEEWKTREPQEGDFYNIPGDPVWVHTNSVVYDAISGIGCFSIAQGGKRCYMHVLAALLGRGTFTTSDGNTFTIEREEDIGWRWNSCSDDEAACMNGLRDEMKTDPVAELVYEGELNTEAHGKVPVKGDGTDAAKYNVPGGGNCWQKCIDLAWDLHWQYDGSSTGGTATQEELEKFWYFVEVDLGDGHLEDSDEFLFNEPEYDDAYRIWWEEKKDFEPTVEEYMDKIILDRVNDKAKAQWYTNLFNAMDGRDMSKIVTTAYDEEANFDHWLVDDIDKVSTEKNHYHIVLDENLQGDTTWIQYALTNGLISMKQAALRTDDNMTWAGIELSSTSDIREVDDKTAVAKAETEYQKVMREIQAEDKKLDIDLKKLDTEHSALKSEYDSVKNVISKNIEKSFSAFS